MIRRFYGVCMFGALHQEPMDDENCNDVVCLECDSLKGLATTWRASGIISAHTPRKKRLRSSVVIPEVFEPFKQHAILTNNIAQFAVEDRYCTRNLLMMSLRM